MTGAQNRVLLNAERHKRAVKALVYALTLDSYFGWKAAALVCQERLRDRELAALAFMALRSLESSDARMTVEAALSIGAGQPQAPLFGFLDQAKFWAEIAEPEELEAYCISSFNGMPAQRQKAFIEFVQSRLAA